MKNFRTLVGTSLILTVVLLSRAASADVVPGEYLVKYRSSQALSMLSLRSIPGMRLESENVPAQLLKVEIAQGQEVPTLIRLLKNDNVEYVVPNSKLYAFKAPVNAKTLQRQWAIEKVHAQEAWTRAGNKGSRNVLVAVIDTGADYNHESLKANMVPGYDFKDNTNDPMDQTSPYGNPGHGTHCSGIIGGTGLVDGGTTGISPEVSIMPLRFLGPDGQGDLDSAIKAIDYAIAHKVQIISASWGASISAEQAKPLSEAVKRAADAGLIFIVAAANNSADNDTTDVFPANSPAVAISVAASNESDGKPDFSNYGKNKVHVAAPGDGIISTLPQNKYGPLSGTSMATPLVAGLVAFLKAQDPDLTAAQARALLQLTGTKVGIETACNCRVDALAAVDALLNKKMFITPAAVTLDAGQSQTFTATFGQPPLHFQVADTSVATITDDGVLKAVKDGSTTVTVTDGRGTTSTSLDIRIGQGSGDNHSGNNPPGGGLPTPPGGNPPGGGLPTPPGGNPPGGGLPTPPGAGSCPFGDQSTCDQICQVEPTMPFCKH